MAFILPGPASVQIPAAVPGLRIEYSRNPDKFHVNRVIQRIFSEKVVGKYLRIDVDEGMRLPDASTRETWPDGVRRPAPFKATHEFPTYTMKRYSDNFDMGSLTIDQATWPIVQSHSAMAASKAMVRKTRIMEALVTDTTNGVQFFDIAGTVGGTWAAADTANQYILQTKNHAVGLIQDATNGQVREEEIICMMAKSTADVIGESPEYQDWLKRTAGQVTFDALRRSSGMHPSGIVSQGGLYGIPVAVFDERMVTSPVGATKASRQYFSGLGIIDSKDVFKPAVFCVRQGGIDGANVSMDDEARAVNAATFSSILEIWKEDMTVEAKTEAFHRITEAAVTTHYDVVLGTPTTVVIAGDALGES